MVTFSLFLFQLTSTTTPGYLRLQGMINYFLSGEIVGLGWCEVCKRYCQMRAAFRKK